MRLKMPSLIKKQIESGNRDVQKGQERDMSKTGNQNFPHYGNLLDYLIWRGDIDFSMDPWNEIDSLIFATIAYSNFGENTISFENTKTISDLIGEDVLNRLPQFDLKPMYEDRMKLVALMAQSKRFQHVRVADQVNVINADRNTQFSVITFQIERVGTVIAYRGTDASLVGWKEDCMLSYETPVPAQTSALNYLERIADRCPGTLHLTGHSKGGNLALYAAAHAPVEIQDRLSSISSFDGPGLDDDTVQSAGYQRICKRVFSLIPSQSIIGLLLNYDPNYHVVDATESFLWQHNPFTWKIAGTQFVTEDSVTPGSQVLNQSLREWLKESSKEQKASFVNALFAMLEKSENGSESSKPEGNAFKEVFPLASKLLAIHAENTYGEKIRKPLATLVEEARWFRRHMKTPTFRSERIDIDNRGYHFVDALAESERICAQAGLSYENAARLRLITEEMLGLLRGITGECKASFHILSDGRLFELFLTTRARLNEMKREILKASGTDDPAEFQKKLRSAFENAMFMDPAGDGDAGAGPETGRDVDARTGAAAGTDDKVDVLAMPGIVEQSMLSKLADSVRIDIYYGSVFLTVMKDFGSENESKGLL